VSEGSADPAAHAVDWIRGERDYVRAADLLNAAPLPSDSKRIEFSIRAPTVCRGRWLPADRQRRMAPPDEIVARLRTWTPREAQRWDFVVNNRLPITKRLDDSTEQSIMRAVSFHPHGVETEMTGAFGLWDHVVVATKALGLRRYPGISWYLAYVLADLGQMPRPMAGRRLTVRLRRVRLAFHEFEFAIDGAVLGLVGARERAGSRAPRLVPTDIAETDRSHADAIGIER
jgi:hypothetical protein